MDLEFLFELRRIADALEKIASCLRPEPKDVDDDDAGDALNFHSQVKGIKSGLFDLAEQGMDVFIPNAVSVRESE
jgi:hypothetical protein